MKSAFRIFFGLCILCGAVYASNEITLQGYIKAEKSSRKVERSPGSISINWNGLRYYGPVIYTTTTNGWSYASKGAVDTNGWLWLRNVGASGSVQVSFDAGATTHLILKTNEFCSMRLDPTYNITNLAFIAVQNGTNAATTNDFEVTILED